MSMRLLVPVLALAAAALASAPHGPDHAAGPALPHTYADCKPVAPLAIEITSSGFAGSVLEVEYRVTPLVDAMELATTVGLPFGGAVLSHADANGRELERGFSRDGYARVRLTEAERDAGGSIQLRASVTFAALGDDGTSGIETQTLVHDLSFGEHLVDLPEVVAFDGELAIPSIEVPALREDSLSQEGR